MKDEKEVSVEDIGKLIGLSPFTASLLTEDMGIKWDIENLRKL